MLSMKNIVIIFFVFAITIIDLLYIISSVPIAVRKSSDFENTRNSFTSPGDASNTRLRMETTFVKQASGSERQPVLRPENRDNLNHQNVFEQSVKTPKLIQNTHYTYDPFVLPPPLRTSAMKFSTMDQLSEYYQLLMKASLECNEDICIHPKKYLNRFGPWTCKDYPNICENPDQILIMQEDKYLVGNVDIIQNGVVDKKIDCGWPADHTKSYEINQSGMADYIEGTLVYLPVPEGMSFQHFIDGLLPKLVQMYDIIKGRKDIHFIFNNRFDDPMPHQLLHRMGISDSQIINEYNFPSRGKYFQAEELILGCQTPPLHPQLWRKAQEILNLPWLQSDWRQKRHIVLYFSRRDGTRNKERDVLNEDTLIDTVKPFVEKKGYEFIVFNANDFASIDSLFDFLANVDVVMGPHGGAFYNILFMRRGITVVEFMPEDSLFVSLRYAVHLIVYIQAMLLGDHYFSILGESHESFNMVIDPSIVLSVLSKRL